LAVNDRIKASVVENMTKLESELKLTKTLLHVPKLRENLKNHDFKELDFKGFLKEVDRLAYEVKELLVKEGCVLPSKGYKQEKV